MFKEREIGSIETSTEYFYKYHRSQDIRRWTC